ncbi:MAG TPA: formate dehydrogenase accessory sulfurtransferase FdhD [Pseudonocardiaceae bacterium]|jgi:FdhD protein
MGRVTARRPIRRLTPDGDIHRPDTLAVEEPFEIRVNGTPLTVTMRTPGDDVDLAHGFLLTEGVIGSREDVLTARYCAGSDVDGMNTYNLLDVRLAPGVPGPDPSVTRNFYTTSSCGVCGKAALDAIRLATRFPIGTGAGTVSSRVLASLPDQLRDHQKVFETTGGIHAAGLFTYDGVLLAVREDVGRHNAVDKVLGWALLADRVPLRDCVLMVSGRASFELAQKAAMAGVPVLAAVSAPSSLAVDVAREQGMTLVGFLRGETMNIYAGDQRVVTHSRQLAEH